MCRPQESEVRSPPGSDDVEGVRPSCASLNVHLLDDGDDVLRRGTSSVAGEAVAPGGTLESA